MNVKLLYQDARYNDKDHTNVSSLTFNSISATLQLDSGNCSVTCLGIILFTAHGSNICSRTPDNFAEPLHWK